MKIYIPNNPLWYLGVVIIFGPLLAVAVLEPEWLVRFISTALFIISIGLISLISGVSRRVYNLGKIRSEWMDKKFGTPASKGEIFGRSFLTILGISVFLLFFPAIIRDVMAINNGTAPIIIESRVVHTRHGFIMKDVTIDSLNFNLYAWFFSPRHITKDNVYEFKYLSNTKFILEARLIKE